MKLRALNLLAIGAGLALLAAPAMAQQGRGFGGIGGGLSLLRLPAALQTKLALTEEQKKTFAETGMKMQEEMRAAFQNGGGPEALQGMREKMMKADADAEASLNPDQKKTYGGWKTEYKNYEGLGQGSVALLALDLNGDQKTKLKALSESTGAKRRELFQSVGQGGDRQELFQKMQAMQAETDTSINAILTADQKTKFEEIKKSMPGPRRRPQQ